jgi:hypothetical protein
MRRHGARHLAIPYKFHREYFNMALSFVPNKDDKSSGTNSFESNEISIITDEPLLLRLT